jgi:hypothetical protein
LFNIYADYLISYLRKAEKLNYETNELGKTVIQSYADDMILIIDSE